MSDFLKAIPFVLAHEGAAFTDGTAVPIVGRVPRGDPPTKYGITLATLRAVRLGATVADVAALSQAAATDVYKQLWWDRYGYGRIVDQQVATKVFDTCVNVGPREHLLLQRALNACGYALPDTGFLGPLTVKATNECEARELLVELGKQQLAHYKAWIAEAPAERTPDLLGLTNRAAWPYSPSVIGA